jgi:hypothetical protein
VCVCVVSVLVLFMGCCSHQDTIYMRVCVCVCVCVLCHCAVVVDSLLARTTYDRSIDRERNTQTNKEKKKETKRQT